MAYARGSRASLLHFCTFADLTFMFSVSHGEVILTTKSEAFKSEKVRTFAPNRVIG